MKKILVLGITGMLGSTVFEYLRHVPGFLVKGTVKDKVFDEDTVHLDASAFDENDFRKIYNAFPFEYVINCIGIINKYCRDDDPAGVLNAVKVNALFPHLLSKACERISVETKIIQIATDCVFSGREGNYDELSPHDPYDVYGKSKSLGEVKAGNLLNIRSSIIGKEIKNKASLLEWFLSHPPGAHVTGFSHHKWNGVTTLQYARFCESIIENERFDVLRKLNHVLHYTPNNAVTKHELLLIFQEVFRTGYNIISRDDIGAPVDRTLHSRFLDFDMIAMKEAVADYYNFINR